jgi:hypothetical protein
MGVAWAFVNLSYDHLAAGAIEVGALAKNMTVPETTMYLNGYSSSLQGLYTTKAFGPSRCVKRIA